MIDDAIQTHLLAKAAEAYPTLEADQFIAKIVSGSATMDSRIVNMREDGSNSFAVYQTTVSIMLIIASETKLDRDALIRLIPRKYVVLDGRKDIFQEYQRWVDADLVEVINYKGVVHYIDYVFNVY